MAPFTWHLLHGAGGVVLRDHHGTFLHGACCFFPYLVDAESPELQACRLGLSVALDKDIRRVVLETDSLGAVAKLNRDE
jgi:hypothetical protein